MADARNNPALRRQTVDTEQFPIGQMPDVSIDSPRESDIVAADSTTVFDQLAFNEEPITILVEASGREDFPVPPQVSVNGVPAEVWDGRRWLKMGFFPLGQEITTKRKYAEVLVGSKPQTVRTKVEELASGQTRNMVSRVAHARFPFTVIEDRNPNGRAWLQELRQRAV